MASTLPDTEAGASDGGVGTGAGVLVGGFQVSGGEGV